MLLFPHHPEIFCALVGIGDHLLATACIVLFLCITGCISSMKRGSIIASVIIAYCLTAVVGGYRSVRLYRQMTLGKHQNHGINQCLVWAGTIVPIPAAGVFICVNLVGKAYGSTAAVPLFANLTILVLYLAVAVPLTYVGGMLAKRYACADFGTPTISTRSTVENDENSVEAPRPESHASSIKKNQVIRCLQYKPLQLLIEGLVPFLTIYIDMDYQLRSLWGIRYDALWGLLTVEMILLIAVASLVTVLVLFCEIAETGIAEGSWWWSTYVNGCMTGCFIYVYSFYYYFEKTGMNGALQGTAYFGYMALISYGVSLVLGSAGVQSSTAFVKYYYSIATRHELDQLVEKDREEQST